MNVKILLLLLFVPVATYAIPVYDGLVSHLNFNAGIADIAGMGTTVTNYNGATTGAGYNGGYGLVLDGSNDYVRVDDVALNTSTGSYTTVGFWMNWSGKDSSMPIGFSNYDLWLQAGNFGFNTAQSDITGIKSTGLANQWVYVTAMFYNGYAPSSSYKIYINGVLQTISQLQGSTPIAQTPVNYFHLGTWGASAGYYFQGTLDEVTIYNRALTSSEVTQMYNFYTTVPEPNTVILFLLLFFGITCLKKSQSFINKKA